MCVPVTAGTALFEHRSFSSKCDKIRWSGRSLEALLLSFLLMPPLKLERRCHKGAFYQAHAAAMAARADSYDVVLFPVPLADAMLVLRNQSHACEPLLRRLDFFQP